MSGGLPVATDWDGEMNRGIALCSGASPPASGLWTFRAAPRFTDGLIRARRRIGGERTAGEEAGLPGGVEVPRWARCIDRHTGSGTGLEAFFLGTGPQDVETFSFVFFPSFFENSSFCGVVALAVRSAHHKNGQ